MRNKLFLIALIIISFINVNAQKTKILISELSNFSKAYELYLDGKYSKAQFEFESLMNSDNISEELKIDCQYYLTICSVKLFQRNTEEIYNDFVKENYNYPKLYLLQLELGNYFFKKKKYDELINCYSQLDRLRLNSNELDEYYFKYAYSCFSVNKFDSAATYFRELKDDNNSYYQNASKYYYGHIAYLKSKYSIALQNFKELENDKAFGPIVPYYITNIYFYRELYDSVITYAPKVLQNASASRQAEISRLVGESYLFNQEYKKALPYLERYCLESQNVKEGDIYKLAFVFYLNGRFADAIRKFEIIPLKEDSLSQNINYHLAYCYLKTDQKEKARMAFFAASKIDKDLKIKEDALFNYAKLSFELSMNPYNQAVIALQDYINNYPNSERSEEFNSYLVEIYLTTRNYKDALKSIQNVKDKNPKLKEAWQKINYYRGVELFNEKRYSDAAKLFQVAIKSPVNRTIEAKAGFWLAESYYRKKNPDYEKARVYYLDFLRMPGSFGSGEYSNAHYSLAYTYFKQGKNLDEKFRNNRTLDQTEQINELFNQASDWFQKYIQNEKDLKSLKYNDALVRTADCFHMKKDFVSSAKWYDKVINQNQLDVDYALFQNARNYGLMGKTSEKIAILERLVADYNKNQFKGRNFEADAKFELADEYFLGEKYDKAEKYFSEIIRNHAQSSYLRKAHLKMGLLYKNTNRKADAIAMFKNIVDKYPATSEAKEAYLSVENIFLKDGKEEELLNWAKTNKYDISRGREDSILYSGAELAYENNDCQSAIKKFSNYLDNFNVGYFSTNARFYMSECLNKNSEFEKAIDGYKYVVNQPKNTFTEKSIYRLSNIYYNSKMFNEAIIYYSMLEEFAEYPANILEAQLGLMRSYYRVDNYKSTNDYADKLLKSDKIGYEVISEAYLLKARIELVNKDYNLAYKYFEKTYTIATDKLKAEARYNMALVLYNQDKYAECERLIFDFVNELPDYDYWIAKAFILLADNYLKQDNSFQAIHTLKSVIDNHEGEELRLEAKQKYDALILAQEEKSKIEKMLLDDLQIQIGDSLDQELEIILDSKIFEEVEINSENSTNEIQMNLMDAINNAVKDPLNNK